ncbi:putative transposase [Nostoc sp. HK-01]|nr:putative transposase [Nostoc sp. HK-01]
MRPQIWQPPIELSALEQSIVKRIKRAKLFTFLRQYRHQLFDSVSIHPDEPLFQELKQRQFTSAGRAKLRERVAVEHSLSHIGRWQTDQARYVGSRKNLFDLRRTAVVHNLHVLAKIFTLTTEPSVTSS